MSNATLHRAPIASGAAPRSDKITDEHLGRLAIVYVRFIYRRIT